MKPQVAVDYSAGTRHAKVRSIAANPAGACSLAHSEKTAIREPIRARDSSNERGFRFSETGMAMPQKKANAFDAFRRELVSHLSEEHAHVSFDTAVENFPAELRGTRPHGLPHSAYQLVEHLRIAQWDIIEYARNPKHKSPEFPGGYWPQSPEPPDAEAWERSIAAFRADRKKLVAALEKLDVLAPIEHANNQSLASKTVLLIDHNAYHLGQLILLRRLLSAWNPGA